MIKNERKILKKLFCSSTRQKRYTAFEAAQCMNDSEVVNTILKRHNKRKVPLVNGRDPVNITFELWVQEISRIKEISSEFELDVYVTETWTDPSLEFDMLNPCRGNISLDAGVPENFYSK